MTPPKLPTSIDVGPFVYTVSDDKTVMNTTCRERSSDLLGNTDHQKLLVLVDPDQAPGMARDTLMHECLHAVTEVTGLATEWGPEKDEAAVRRLSPALLDLLRRNPALVAYLTADG